MYRARLRTMSNERLAQEAGMRILDAAIMAGRRSDDGWADDQAGACYNEAKARGNPDLYQRGFNDAVRSQGHTGMVREVTMPRARRRHGDGAVTRSELQESERDGSRGGGVHVVYVTDGRGICPVCGNGLWPGQPPCAHRTAARKAPDG
jgi:hypothetical protein